MKRIVTRKGKLENKVRDELAKEFPKLGPILDAVDTFHKDNLATIDKLKKKKQIEAKRINGALKQCINSHGPITKLLIGSASKRIYGALLSNHNEEEKKKKVSVKSMLIGAAIITVLYIIINLIF